MSLFGFSYQCDEGFDGFDEIFRANSREDVLDFILTNIKEYLIELEEYEKHHGKRPDWSYNVVNEKGEKYFDMISRSDWRHILNIPYRECGNDLEMFMKWGTVGHLEKIIEGSYVDGDSYFQVSLQKIDVTVDLI